MLQRTLPAGFIAPGLPTKIDKLPPGSQWLHEIKHDGFRVIARKDGPRVRLFPSALDGFFEQNIDSGDVMIEIHASLHKFEGQDQSGPYARPMIVTKRAATASAAATE